VGAPAGPEEVASAERELGFRLPSLIRSLYLEIANGGFGPGYGLVGLPGGVPDIDSGKDLISLYSAFRQPDPSDKLWKWPEELLPVANIGCGMYYCLNFRSAAGAITWFEPNPHADGEPWDDAFIPLVDSTEGWFRAWLNGEELLEDAWNRKFGAG